MPRATRHYRLRIRNAADSADDLILTSVPGGTNPYLTGPPQGDGQEIDPATGESSIGAYTIEAADVSEIITAALVDGDGRQTLIQRRAYLELSTDVGSTWPTVLIPGFVNAYRLVTPMRWAFTIGESRRIEYTRKVWDRTTDNFEQATCLIGGPFRGDWGPIAGRGDGWRFEVIDTDATTVTLRVLFGWFPIEGSTPGYQFGITPYARIRANNLASAEEVLIETAANTATYPGIVVLVETENGTEVDRFTALAQELGPQLSHVILLNDDIKLLRAGTAWGGSPPSNGTIFRVYAWRTTIGEDNPLHIDAHPIDILTDLWDEAGIAYDSTEATTVRGLLGDNNRLRLRINEPWVLRDVEQMIGGLFGVVTRVGTDGELELITTRIRGIAAPSSLYDDDDLRSPDTVIFEVDEATIYNKVVVEQLQFRQWGSGMGERPPDDIAAQRRVQFFDLDSEGGGTLDSDTFGVRELRFTVPGTVLSSVSGWGLGDVYFEKGLATEVFDRFGRGGVYGTVAALPAITEKVGQEIRLDVSHLPNAGVRGGERIMQIVRRTETPSGPSLLLLDSGPNSQFATAPTFSLAAGAADGRKYVDITVTNAAALNTAGAWLRVEWDVAGSEPSAGSVLTQYTAGEIPTSFTTPAVDAGSHIWMRMQAFIPGKRPTAYTAWQDVDLTDLTAPSSLSRSVGSDPARNTITFTPGESDIPLEVFQRPQGDPANEAVVVDRLPPGSDRVTLTLEPGSSYTIGIRYREQADFSGVSNTTEISFTVAGSPDTLPAPTQVFALGTKWSVGSLGGVWPDDTADHYAVGLRVRSAIEEGFVEFEMARETAVGSGTPGSYSLLERRSVIGVDETYIFTVGVALDGKLRYLRARHARVGATASAYTNVVSVMPGDILSPPPPVDPLEITDVVPVTLGGTEIADPTLGVLLVGAGSSAMTQLAPGAAAGYARSTGSAWARSGLLAGDLTGTVPSARLAGVYSGITGLGTQAQALDMGANNITNVGTYSGGAISTTGTFTLSSTQPVLDFNETDGPTDEKFWRWTASIGDLYLQTKTDALGVGANVLRITRTGTTVDLIRVVATTVDVVGALTATTGTFTGLLKRTFSSDAASGILLESTAAGELSPRLFFYNTNNAGQGCSIVLSANSSLAFATGATPESSSGTNRMLMTATAFTPFSDNGLTLGTTAKTWGAAYMGALTATTVDTTGRLAVVAAADSSFTGGGSVGVGTASPQRDLHIEGGVPTIRLSDSNAATDQAVATLIELYRGNLTNRVGFWGMESSSNNVMKLATDYAAGEIAFSTGSSVEALRLASNQVAIFAAGITATTGAFSSYLQGTTGNGYLDLRGDSGAASGLRIDDSGNVLIGTTTDAGFKLDVNGTGRVSGDFTIGSLGTFDSTSAPSTDFILRYDGSKWVSAYLHTQFFAGDGISQINGDGTTSAFVYSSPSLSGAPSPNPSAAPVITASHKSIKIDMRAYTLGATETFVLDYSIDGGAYTTDAIISTGTQVVHATLTPGSTYAYKYKIRGGSDTPYSPASTATNPLNDSSAQTFGIVLAAQVVATNLAAISADIGDISAGQIRNAANTKGVLLSGSLPGGWTQYIDFVATGANPFIKHDKFSLFADGSAVFGGQIDITDVSTQTTGSMNDQWLLLRDPDVAHGMTTVLETDIVAAIGEFSDTKGGLWIQGFMEASAAAIGVHLSGIIDTGSGMDAAVVVSGWKKSGTSFGAMATTDVVFTIRPGAGSDVFAITAAGDITGPNDLTLSGDFNISERSPATFTDHVVDYDTGTTTVQRLDGGASSRNITGFAGGRAGRLISIVNVGGNFLKLIHEHVSSAAANRIIVPNGTSYNIGVDSSVFLWYDSTASRWRVIGPVI